LFSKKKEKEAREKKRRARTKLSQTASMDERETRARSPQGGGGGGLAPFPHGSCEWREEDEAALATAQANGWNMTLSSGTVGAASRRWEILDMSGAGLLVVSPRLLAFTNITQLYLSYNRLAAIPEEVCNMKRLRCLHVSSNAIAQITPSIERLQELRELDVGNNQITHLPYEVGRLWRLLHLNLEGNPLEFPPPNIVHAGPLVTVEFLRDQLPRKEETNTRKHAFSLVHILTSMLSLAAAPPPPPKRKWRQLEQISSEDYSRPLLRVMTYNVLAESYGTPECYAYTPSWALEWDYRKQRILEEITLCNADVICLQEVEGRQHLEFFRPALMQAGYGSFFRPKSRARTKENWPSVDGTSAATDPRLIGSC
jgi:CCR4-NOT transcription complex subunit 6